MSAKTPVALKTELDGLEADFAVVLKQRDDEIRDLKTVTKSTRDKLEEYDKRYTDLKGRLDQLAVKATRAGVPFGPPAGNKAPTLESAIRDFMGKAFPVDEDSVEYAGRKMNRRLADLVKGTAVRGGFRMDLDALGIKSMLKRATKASLGGISSTDLSNLQEISGERVQELFGPPVEGDQVIELFGSARTESDRIHFVREKNFSALYAKITSSASSGQKEIVVENANGFFPGQVVKIETQSDPVLTEAGVVDEVDLDTNTITLVSNLSSTHAANTASVASFVSSKQYTFTPKASIKPNSAIETVYDVQDVETLATLIDLPRQVFLDHGQLVAHIQKRLVQYQRRNLAREMLFGDGETGHFLGVWNHTEVPTYAWSDGTVGDTKFIALRRAMTVARLAQYVVDAVIMSPQDFEDVEVALAGNGSQLWLYAANGAQPRVWRMNVVQSTDMEPGKALLGAFAGAATLWDREQAAIEVFDQHDKNVAKNLITMRGELRAGFTIERPEAFVKVDFDEAPSEESA